MSLLTHTELLEIVQQGVISGVRLDHVNAASIDITLGNTIWVEDSPSGRHSVVDLSQKEIPHMCMLDMEHGSGFFDLPPGGFCLAGTREAFNLPDDLAAEYKLKSSLARAGLDAALAMWCVTGDTHIPLLNGTVEAIENLVGQQVWLYAVDNQGRTVPGFASRVWKTREVMELVEIMLDDGSVIRSTPEHLFRNRSGAWTAAEDLAAGTPLMSIERKRDAYNGTHEMVYSPTGFRRRWVPTHVVVDRERNGSLPKGCVVHHIDHNPYNNEPGNLVRMTMEEHNLHHHATLPPERKAVLSQLRSQKAQLQNATRWASADARKAASTWAKENDTAKSLRSFINTNKDEWYVRTLAGTVRKVLESLATAGVPVTPDNYLAFKRQNAPTVAKLESVFGSFSQAVEAAEYRNHVVVGVKHIHLDTPTPVYDMTVDTHHSFVLWNGVVSHNCDPGWHGSVLTLELTNVLKMHSLRLRPGMKIGQMIFHRGNPVPEHASYAVRGSYNNDKTATPSRGVK